MEEARQHGACKEYEARLEDALAWGLELRAEAGKQESVSGSELAAHLAKCARCSQALRAAQEAQALLQGGLEPTPEPQPALVTRVMAGIREREAQERQEASEFWGPIEQLARRLAWVATLALLVLGAYGLGIMSGSSRTEMTSTNELREIFPDPNRLPMDTDEVVERLAGNTNGR